MTTAERPAFAAVMALMLQAFVIRGLPRDEDQASKAILQKTEVYFEALKDLSLEMVRQGAWDLIRFRPWREFPTPAEIRDAAEEHRPALPPAPPVLELRESEDERLANLRLARGLLADLSAKLGWERAVPRPAPMAVPDDATVVELRRAESADPNHQARKRAAVERFKGVA